MPQQRKSLIKEGFIKVWAGVEKPKGTVWLPRAGGNGELLPLPDQARARSGRQNSGSVAGERRAACLTGAGPSLEGGARPNVPLPVPPRRPSHWCIPLATPNRNPKGRRAAAEVQTPASGLEWAPNQGSSRNCPARGQGMLFFSRTLINVRLPIQNVVAVS